jgi:hypothetical protein
LNELNKNINQLESILHQKAMNIQSINKGKTSTDKYELAPETDNVNLAALNQKRQASPDTQ